MKTRLVLLCVAFGLVLLVTGCGTYALNSRIHEKSAVYDALKAWQKKYIARGIISTDFTTDMVYMTLGKPSLVEPVDTTDGSVSELWTYLHFYPSPDALHMRYSDFSRDLPYQQIQDRKVLSERPLTRPQSIHTTGGPQGGSMEPADIPDYTLKLLFDDGKVTRIGMKPN